MRGVLLLPALLTVAPAVSPMASAQPQVMIYRCTDAAGRLSLRDSPCRKGERQEVRSMLKPTDPPPSRTAAAPRMRSAPTPVVLQPRVVYVTPPRPTYECTTPDGERYTSESPEGNPRWVPMWTLGYPAVVAVPGADGGFGGRVEYRGGDTTVRVDAGRRWRSGGGLIPVAPAAVVPAGAWVRDTCHPLPPAEACARLQDRRDMLDRRYNSALQSERDAIVREQRGIDARLSGECAG